MEREKNLRQLTARRVPRREASQSFKNFHQNYFSLFFKIFIFFNNAIKNKLLGEARYLCNQP